MRTGTLACTQSREAVLLAALALQRLAVLLRGLARRTNCFCGQLTPWPACMPHQACQCKRQARGVLQALTSSAFCPAIADAHLHGPRYPRREDCTCTNWTTPAPFFCSSKAGPITHDHCYPRPPAVIGKQARAASLAGMSLAHSCCIYWRLGKAGQHTGLREDLEQALLLEPPRHTHINKMLSARVNAGGRMPSSLLV